MNSMEHATLGIVRRIFYKIPSTWYNNAIPALEKSSSNQCDVRRYFHKTLLQCTISESKEEDILDKPKIRKLHNITTGPSLRDFLHKLPDNNKQSLVAEEVPYIKSIYGGGKKVYMDIYGCQMNVNDAEVILSILKSSGYNFTDKLDDADVILILTCAIREGAEEKIWQRLRKFKYMQTVKKHLAISSRPKIGLLGCMAERLKNKLLEKDRLVDVVAGPDSYKDLPRLLAVTDDKETAINVVLSFDETYADITPVRLDPSSPTAYVSITRGCDNMCTFCIVPFTRGRERSRPVKSIEDEIRRLSDEGVKEVTLLGQNVNSYRDESVDSFTDASQTNLAKGFKTVYKSKKGGLRFSDLLDKVSLIDPNMRIRFTSAHPKDFPDEVLHLIAERSNICKQLHLPAQSGNSEVLERMRRGYTREAYLELVEHVRSIIPNVYFSSDFIAGFCGETESQFEDTISLIQMVKYNSAFLFAYSMREKTAAHRRYKDDVEKSVKKNRLQRMIEVHRTEAKKLHEAQIGQQQLILIEGTSRRSSQQLQGRNDGNSRVLIPDCSVQESKYTSFTRKAVPGDYVVVQISDSNSQTLKGTPLYFSSITEFHSEAEQRFEVFCK